MMSQWWAGPMLNQDYLSMQVMPSFKIETHVMYTENGLERHRISLLLNLPNKAIVNNILSLFSTNACFLIGKSG